MLVQSGSETAAVGAGLRTSPTISGSETAAVGAGLLTSPTFFVAGSSLLRGSGHKNSCSETAAGESGLLTSLSHPFSTHEHRTPRYRSFHIPSVLSHTLCANGYTRSMCTLTHRLDQSQRRQTMHYKQAKTTPTQIEAHKTSGWKYRAGREHNYSRNYSTQTQWKYSTKTQTHRSLQYKAVWKQGIQMLKASSASIKYTHSNKKTLPRAFSLNTEQK
ncbi:UNVERIFIED_CONTAM: hypothetical protein FKN15_032108 [Acipenser sinensis]